MKIIQLDIEGFRSFKQQSWRPGDLNVLIGPNASGKSNVLRVLEMIGTAARGELSRFVYQEEGGMPAILWDGQASQVLVRAKMTPLAPYTDAERDALTYEFDLQRLGNSSAYRINREILANFCRVDAGEETTPHLLLERDSRSAVVFSMKDQRFEAHQESVPDTETLLSFTGGPFSVNPFVAGFQEVLAAWTIHQNFRTDRRANIRDPQITRAESQIDADGQNLVSVLQSLYNGDRGFEEDVNDAMQAAFGGDFEKLVFPAVADGRLQLGIRWRSLRHPRSAADISDGTFRFLFLIAVLANPKPPPLIAIDEPETGLHPSMLPIVADYARDAATRSQVIFTTHSPEFLDAFGAERPTTTVVERHEGQTVLRTLSDDKLSSWLQDYTLGELYRSKELEALP